MWKMLSSKTIFSHPRIILVEDSVRLPNGASITYLKFKTIGNAVTLICKRSDNKILLQKEYSYPTKKKLFQFPGGFVPLNEELDKGANRELMEEAKFKAGRLKLLGSYFLDNRRSSAKMYVYFASKLKEQSLDGDLEEDIQSYWFSENQIEKMIGSGKITNGTVLAAWSLYKMGI